MPEPKLSVAQFAAQVRSKYPEYNNIDDATLAKAMVDKYPVYAEKVDFGVKKKEPSEFTTPKVDMESPTETGSLEPVETQPKKKVTITTPDGNPAVVEWGPTEFKRSEEAPVPDMRLSDIVGNVNATIDEATKNRLASAIGVTGGVISKVIGQNPLKTTGEAIQDAKKFAENTATAYNVGVLGAQILNNQSDDVPDFERIAELKKKQNEESKKLLSTQMKGQGVGDFFEMMSTNPATYLTEVLTTSATQLAGGLGSLQVEEIPLVAGLGAFTGGVGARGYLAGRNSLAAEMSSRTLDKLEEKGVDVTDAKQLRAAFENKDLMSTIAKEIEAPSSIIAAFDVVSAMAAGGLGTPIKEIAAQMAAGSAGEAAAQIAESGRITAPAAVLTEAIAELPGGLAEIGFAAKTKDIGRKAQVNKDIKDIESQIESTEDAQTKDILLSELNKLRGEKNKIFKEYVDFANALPEEQVAQLNELNQQVVRLTNAIENVGIDSVKKSLSDQRDAAIAKIAELESQVTPKTETDAVQEQAAGEVPVQPGATVGEEVAQGEPQAGPEIPAEEGQATEEVVAEAAPEEAAPATQQLTEQDLPGFDRMMEELDGVIKKSEQRRASRAKIFENAMSYVVGSKAYETATDVQRESLVRMVNKMFGKRERSAPSVGRLFGAVKDINKITMAESELLKNQIRSAARGAKEAKTAISNASKEVSDSLKELITKGQVTVKQAGALVKRFSRVNPLDDASIDKFVNYATKVFQNAEYDDIIRNLASNAKKAKKNSQTKLGISEGLVQPLLRIFSIKPSAIPDSVFGTYQELVDVMSKRKAVLELPEVQSLREKAQSVIDAVDFELSMVPSLAYEFDSYAEKVLTKDGKLDYTATVNKMVKEGVVTDEQAQILRDYRSSILPRAEKKQRSEAEIQEERQILMDIISESEVNPNELPSRDERELAQKLADLIKTDAVEALDNDQLNNLVRVIDNIDNGYIPHYAQLMVERLTAINNADTLAGAIEEAKPLPVSSAISKIKATLSKGKPVVEMIRRNPLFYIDQLFGNFKSKDIFDSVFGAVARAQSKYETASDDISNRLNEAREKVFKSLKFDSNAATLSKFKMMTYLRQLEFLSNPGSNQVNPAVAYLQATIDQIDADSSIYGEKDAEMLQQILDEYATDGNIDMDKLYASFNSAEKAAIEEIQKINTELRDKAIHTAVVIRGDKITPLENYVHLNVLYEHNPKETLIGDAFINDYNNSLRPSTRAKSLIERTGTVSPINFDVFSSTSRGANYVLMDYYLTEPVRTARKMFNEAGKMLKEDGASREKKGILNSIKSVFEESIDNLLSKSFSSSSLADEVADYVSRQGYRTMLAGVPKFLGELISNLSFAAMFPNDMMAGIELRDVVLSSDGSKIMNSVGSKQTKRLYPNESLSGRLIDTSIMNQAAGAKGGRAKSDVANKIQQIYNVMLIRKTANGIAVLSDALISTPDKLVMRPLWFGSFVNEFKKASGGVEPNLDLIAQNDEQYMNDNKAAIEAATKIADEKSTFLGASDNAFTGILKGVPKKDQRPIMRYLNQFNSFMTRFLIYEFVTARTGIYAAMGNGSISRKQGVALLAGVTTRMVLYATLVPILNELMVSMLTDAEEEDDKTFLQRLSQGTISAISSLLLGRDFGNLVKVPVSYGVERMNQEYFDFLRNGDYDPYEDQIMFSQIPVEERGLQGLSIGDFLVNTLGPYSPTLRTASLIGKKMFGPEKKEADAIARSEKEKKIRIPLEIAGQAGLVPFYKDIRKVVLAEMYKDLEKGTKSSGLDKLTKSQLQLLYPEVYNEMYGPGGIMLDYEQIKKQVEAERKAIMSSSKDEAYR
jgi:hypothetical protein